MVDSTPESSVEGAFPPGDPNRGFRAVSTAVRIANREDVGLGLFDLAHKLLGG